MEYMSLVDTRVHNLISVTLVKHAYIFYLSKVPKKSTTGSPAARIGLWVFDR
jgi:hypothetical protein